MMRGHLRHVLRARDTMRDRSIAQHRRDLATEAYTRSVDRIVDLLGSLSERPVATGSGAKPALEVLEEVLTAITEAEAKLRRAL